MTVDLGGRSMDLRTEHGRATAIQRFLNQASRGKSLNVQVGDRKTGITRVHASGEGRLAPSPTPWFEDVKAMYALRGAGVDPNQAYDIVKRSIEQLEKAGIRPVRIPAR
jgi:hypothetical protein